MAGKVQQKPRTQTRPNRSTARKAPAKKASAAKKPNAGSKDVSTISPQARAKESGSSRLPDLSWGKKAGEAAASTSATTGQSSPSQPGAQGKESASKEIPAPPQRPHIGNHYAGAREKLDRYEAQMGAWREKYGDAWDKQQKEKEEARKKRAKENPPKPLPPGWRKPIGA